MRVLVIPNGFPSEMQPYNGIFVLRQVRELIALGHDVRVLRIVPLFSLPGRRKRIALPSRSQVEGVAVRTARRIFLPRLAALGALRAFAGGAIRREIRAFRPDLIHAHAILPSGYLAFGRGVPTVLTSHGSDAYLTPLRRPGLARAARRALREATAVVGVSDFIRRKVAELGRSDARTILNGADESVFYRRARSEARVELSLPDERFVIAFVGNLLVAKGVFELASACAALSDLRPLLLVAGDGPAAAGLFARLDEAGVEYRRFGSVGQSMVATILAAADVLTLPSHQEGLPSILCEAMLSHRAIVATPVGGIPEIVVPGETGWIVPVREPAALADALRRIYDAPEQRTAFERNAGVFAERHLTWRVNARAYDRVYAELVAGATGP